jgi:hypothetical protein
VLDVVQGHAGGHDVVRAGRRRQVLDVADLEGRVRRPVGRVAAATIRAEPSTPR